MSKKLYSLGVLVGRFQMLHTGHEEMIRAALALCDKVGIFIGSSEESGTANNPFTYEIRRDMIRRVFGDKPEIYPLPDIGVGNCAAWGEYVLDNVVSRFGRLPDVAVSGKEVRRVSWLEGERGVSVAEVYVPKSIVISATEMRDFMIADDEETWRRYTNPLLWDMYGTLRTFVLSSLDKTETGSI